MKLEFFNHIVAGSLIAYGLFFAQLGLLALVAMVRDGVSWSYIATGVFCIGLGMYWVFQGCTIPVEERNEFGITDAELIALAERVYGHSVNL